MNHRVKLSTSEMAHLWTTYLNDSLAKLMLEYFLQNVDDSVVKEALEGALSTSKEHLTFLNNLFEQFQWALRRKT